MAEAEIKGETFERMKRAWVTDEDGNRRKVERPARLKKWWHKDAAGNVILRILYGSKAIELQKGKSAVEVGQLDKLPAILKTIKDAVAAGELDAEIGVIAEERVPKKKLKIKAWGTPNQGCLFSNSANGTNLHPASTCSIFRHRKLGPDDWPLRYPLGLRARKYSSNNRLRGSLCAAFAFHRGLTITQLKDDPMATGTVKWFNDQKGYGFVQPDDGSKDVFVHISAVEGAGLRTLKEGQKISFEIVTDKRTGKSSAGNLTAS
jgi:cold shock protein